MSCQIRGEPKPLQEWILPVGRKVRAPFASENRRIIITPDGKLSLHDADTSDTGLYRCVASNYLDADILDFRVTVFSPDVEETEVNGVQRSRQVGENLVSDCSISGNSEASVQWIFPDHSILDRSHGNRKVYENGTLRIEGVTVRDQGFYRCVVANHVGVDLLVFHLTVTGENLDKVVDLDEGSGMNMEGDQTLTDDNEIPLSTSFDRHNQELRTITLERPYPRLRSQGKAGSRGTLGERRLGPVNSRHILINRVFDKASGKVDPSVFSGDGEIGSEEDHEDHLIFVPSTVKPTSDNSQEAGILGQENRQFEIMIIKGSQNGIVATAGKHKTTGKEIRDSNELDFSITTNLFKKKEERTQRTESKSVVSQFDINSPKNISFDERTEFDTTERTTKPSSISGTDSSQETQLDFSEEHEKAFSYTTDPNITLMRDGLGPVELFVYQDPKSQTKFTAITTTERKKDQITFHTTQNIKSPHLPPGSTIISQQHIHIIPHKSGRIGGQKRTFRGRRRNIKPNRIIGIQSFINKRKQQPVKKEGDASVPYRIEQSTSKQTCLL